MEYVITFKNTNQAIKGENSLLKAGIPVSVLPLPSQIRAGCGICLRVREDTIKIALKILFQNEIKEIELYRKITEDNKSKYQKVEKDDNDYKNYNERRCDDEF